MPLLWAIRENLGLTGTKWLRSGPVWCLHRTFEWRSDPLCVTPVAAAQGAEVTTIEGLANADGELHPLQQAWIDEQGTTMWLLSVWPNHVSSCLAGNKPKPRRCGD